MLRTYDRLAARAASGRLVEVVKVGGGCEAPPPPSSTILHHLHRLSRTCPGRVEGDFIGAKDRPANPTGASDPEGVAWAKQGQEAPFPQLGGRHQRPTFSPLVRMVRGPNGKA